MSGKIFILNFMLLVTGCTINHNLESRKFDKKKWVSSSDYRWEVSKSRDFPDLKGKSKRQIRRILGEPDYIRDNNFIYCLGITSMEAKTNLSKCNGSFLIVNLDKHNPYNATFVWVEPLYEE